MICFQEGIFSPWEVVSMALDPVWIAPIMLTVSVSPVSLWCWDHPPTWHQSEVSRRRTTRLHATLLSARSRELPQRETDGPSPSVTGLDWVNMLRWSRYYQVISKEGRKGVILYLVTSSFVIQFPLLRPMSSPKKKCYEGKWLNFQRQNNNPCNESESWINIVICITSQLNHHLEGRKDPRLLKRFLTLRGEFLVTSATHRRIAMVASFTLGWRQLERLE